MPASVARQHRRRVLVVDDHPIIRQGLSLLINREADLEVCGESDGTGSILAEIDGKGPDVIILDVALPAPAVDGIEMLKEIRSAQHKLPVLMLSMHDESIYAERALRAGANGYIMKQEATEKVLVALRRILLGEIYVSERVKDLMLQQLMPRTGRREGAPINVLSDRELEVFRLIGRGHGTQKIAEELHLSVKTVESYKAHIKEKLSLQSARDLIERAIDWRLSEKNG